MIHFYKLMLVFSCFLTIASYAANPGMISPADRSTVNIATPLVIKTQANDAAAKTIYIKVLLNDPRKLVYENKQTVIAGQSNSFTIPNSQLAASQQYLIELKTVGASGQLIGQRYFTIFTAYILSLESKPLLISPKDTLVLYDISRGFGLQVNANNPKARKITVDFELGSIQSGSSTFALSNSQQATQPFDVGYSFSAFGSVYNVVSLKKLVLTIKDSLNNLIAQNTYSIPVIIRTPTGPKFISPAPNAVGVSTTPTIVTGNYSTKDCVKWVFSSYEIDRYPADWQGADYIYSSVASDANQWKPPVTLKPNTKYEVRVYGGWICYSAVYYTSTFTTGSGASSRVAGASVDLESESKSIASPNPFTDELSIQLDATYQNALVTIVSMEGRVVFSKQASANEYIRFKDSSLSSGLYLINISDNTGKKEQFKVLKQ